MSDEKYGFLNEQVPEAASVEQAAPEPVAQVETPEPPAPAAPTVAEPREETHVPLAALKAEREKRQAYERRIAELEAASRAAPEPAPDFYADPTQFIAQREQQLTQRMHAALEEQARDAYADYDEVLAELQEFAQTNPWVAPQVFGAANPALAAYKLGKQQREMKAMQNPGEYRAKLEAEIRASIKAEQDAAAASRAAAVAAIPPDLASARSAATVEPVAEEMTLDSILNERKKR